MCNILRGKNSYHCLSDAYGGLRLRPQSFASNAAVTKDKVLLQFARILHHLDRDK
ncbi:hypothetical protein [Nostoc sp.]